MKYEVVVYYDDMVDSVHTFNNKNEAINELHRLRGIKYRSQIGQIQNVGSNNRRNIHRAKLGINTKKLNRILTLEQLPDSRMYRVELEEVKQYDGQG